MDLRKIRLEEHDAVKGVEEAFEVDAEDISPESFAGLHILLERSGLIDLEEREFHAGPATGDHTVRFTIENTTKTRVAVFVDVELTPPLAELSEFIKAIGHPLGPVGVR